MEETEDSDQSLARRVLSEGAGSSRSARPGSARPVEPVQQRGLKQQRRQAGARSTLGPVRLYSCSLGIIDKGKALTLRHA